MTTLSLALQLPHELEQLLGVDMMSEQQATEFVSNIGDLILETALLRYLDVAAPDDAAVFQTWVHVHSQQTDFLPRLFAAFPDFKIIIDEEAAHFYTQAKTIAAT